MATRRPVLAVTLTAVLLAVAIFGFGFLMMAFPGGGWGPMGSGAMRGYGPGYGYGMMGGDLATFSPGWNTSRTDLNLSTDDVRSYFERSIAWQGNPRLKVGEVKEQDVDTIVVDVVTRDNSLVQRFTINRHNGRFRPSED